MRASAASSAARSRAARSADSGPASARAFSRAPSPGTTKGRFRRRRDAALARGHLSRSFSSARRRGARGRWPPPPPPPRACSRVTPPGRTDAACARAGPRTPLRTARTVRSASARARARRPRETRSRHSRNASRRSARRLAEASASRHAAARSPARRARMVSRSRASLDSIKARLESCFAEPSWLRRSAARAGEGGAVVERGDGGRVRLEIAPARGALGRELVLQRLNAARGRLARLPQLHVKQSELLLVRALPVQNLGFVLRVLADGFVARFGDGVQKLAPVPARLLAFLPAESEHEPARRRARLVAVPAQLDAYVVQARKLALVAAQRFPGGVRDHVRRVAHEMLSLRDVAHEARPGGAVPERARQRRGRRDERGLVRVVVQGFVRPTAVRGDARLRQPLRVCAPRVHLSVQQGRGRNKSLQLGHGVPNLVRLRLRLLVHLDRLADLDRARGVVIKSGERGHRAHRGLGAGGRDEGRGVVWGEPEENGIGPFLGTPSRAEADS